MKKTLKVLMMLGCFPMMLSAKEYKKSESLSLDKGWEFAQVGRNEWLPATVPGTVHQDLISHNKLPNPFYGMNEQKVQWVENEDWVYKTTFNVTDEQLSRDAALLILEGLDTYADIYLNGSLLERTDNMFVGYTLPVKRCCGREKTICRFCFIHLSSKLYPNGKPMVLIILLIMIIVISGLVSIAVKRLTVMAGIGESAW